jgi:transcriptional regulator with XRE-family HTH domain
MNDHSPEERGIRGTLSTRLKEVREYCGFTQEEVAAHLGLSRTAISLMENGARRVGALELQRLAKLYQTTMESLTGHDQESLEPESVRLVARATAKLSVNDREEVLRFAQFLRSRKSDEQA